MPVMWNIQVNKLKMKPTLILSLSLIVSACILAFALTKPSPQEECHEFLMRAHQDYKNCYTNKAAEGDTEECDVHPQLEFIAREIVWNNSYRPHDELEMRTVALKHCGIGNVHK